MVLACETRKKVLDDENSCNLLRRKLIVYVLHSGCCGNILAAAPRLRGCEFPLVSSQTRNSRIAFALDLRDDFIESRIIRWKKERTSKINAGRARSRAETSKNIGNVYSEKTDQVLCSTEILGDLIQRSVRHQ